MVTHSDGDKLFVRFYWRRARRRCWKTNYKPGFVSDGEPCKTNSKIYHWNYCYCRRTVFFLMAYKHGASPRDSSTPCERHGDFISPVSRSLVQRIKSKEIKNDKQVSRKSRRSTFSPLLRGGIEFISIFVSKEARAPISGVKNRYYDVFTLTTIRCVFVSKTCFRLNFEANALFFFSF